MDFVWYLVPLIFNLVALTFVVKPRIPKKDKESCPLWSVSEIRFMFCVLYVVAFIPFINVVGSIFTAAALVTSLAFIVRDNLFEKEENEEIL